MNVVAHGPFRVASLVWQPRPGAWSLTVACRSGFELAPGESPLVTLPKEERSLAEQAAMTALEKPRPEIVVVGDAYAPDGKPVTALFVRIAVDELDETIQVTPESTATGTDPFTRTPFRWDHALPALTGGERIVLENLHPRHARLVTRLLVVPPRATLGIEGVSREVPLRCDTLLIDTDRGIAQLVWRGQVALDHPKQEGIVIVERAAASAPAAPTSTVVLADLTPAPDRDGSVVQTIAAPAVPPGPALPFHAEALDAAVDHPTPLLPRPLAPAGGETIAPLRIPPKPTLPFGGRSSAQPVPAAPRFGAPPLTPPEALPAPRFGAPPPEPPAAPPTPPPAPEEPPPAPPPMIGPLATPEMAAADPSTGVEAREPEGEAADGPLPIEAYPIDRCARIAASIARRPKKKAAILKAEELARDRWSALHAHWLEQIHAESGPRKKALLETYDTAYVARLEEERGPIGMEEYAAIVVASERGKGDALLEKMGLPREAMIRIRRVWLARVVKDGEAAKALREAVRTAEEV